MVRVVEAVDSAVADEETVDFSEDVVAFTAQAFGQAAPEVIPAISAQGGLGTPFMIPQPCVVEASAFCASNYVRE